MRLDRAGAITAGIAAAAALAVGPACGEPIPDTDEIILAGSLNAARLDSLLIPDGARVVISLPGGDEAVYLRLSDALRRARAKLVFDGDCFSACAEILISTRTERVLTRRSLIAFHWNSQIRLHEARGRVSEPCLSAYQERAAALTAHHRDAGADPRYWTVTREAMAPTYLGSLDPEDSRHEPCRYEVHYTFHWWLPTSRQLAAMTGLDLSGPICNDDLACVEARMAPRTGQAIVVGSDQYVVKPSGLRRVGTFGYTLDALIAGLQASR